jgi:hypothetical protein
MNETPMDRYARSWARGDYLRGGDRGPAGCLLYRGSTLAGVPTLRGDLPPGFGEREDWASDDPFRRAWTGEAQLAVVVYEEATVAVYVGQTRGEYWAVEAYLDRCYGQAAGERVAR